MDLLTITAISVGVFSGLWGFLSTSVGLITWVGFIGCTSYYASCRNFEGFKNSIITNISGVAWAMAMILSNKMFTGSLWPNIVIGFFSFIMCIQAKSKHLLFIPGAFCGACCVFGTEGKWQLVIISLICGAILGIISDSSGIFLHRLINKN